MNVSYASSLVGAGTTGPAFNLLASASLPGAALMMRPFASRISRLTRSAVGMNRVLSPIVCLICGFAEIVADGCLDNGVTPLTPGRRILGGADSTLGLAEPDGNGMFAGPPSGGARIR